MGGAAGDRSIRKRQVSRIENTAAFAICTLIVAIGNRQTRDEYRNAGHRDIKNPELWRTDGRAALNGQTPSNLVPDHKSATNDQLAIGQTNDAVRCERKI